MKLGKLRSSLCDLSTEMTKRSERMSEGAPQPFWKGPRVWDEPKVEDQLPPAFGHSVKVTERCMEYAQQSIRAWQAGVGAMCVVTVLAGGGWWYETQKSHVETIFVPFDQLGKVGEVYVPNIKDPPDTVKQAFAQDLIFRAFWKTPDSVLGGEFTDWLNKRLGSQAIQQWNKWSKERNVDVTARIIEDIKVKPTLSAGTFLVSWRERDYKDGRETARRAVEGEMKVEAPQRKYMDISNPTGLRAEYFVWGPTYESK